MVDADVITFCVAQVLASLDKSDVGEGRLDRLFGAVRGPVVNDHDLAVEIAYRMQACEAFNSIRLAIPV